jgi:hypothetical protein
MVQSRFYLVKFQAFRHTGIFHFDLISCVSFIVILEKMMGNGPSSRRREQGVGGVAGYLIELGGA